jgi:hypothetical protein
MANQNQQNDKSMDNPDKNTADKAGQPGKKGTDQSQAGTAGQGRPSQQGGSEGGKHQGGSQTGGSGQGK